MPFIVGRLDAGYRARPECRKFIDREPSQYLRRFYYDTIIHSRRSSKFLIETVGADRVMFGTDFPFDMSATSPVDEIESQTHLTSVQFAEIYAGVAENFLALENAGQQLKQA